MFTSKMARCSLWFVGLFFAACASAPEDANDSANAVRPLSQEVATTPDKTVPCGPGGTCPSGEECEATTNSCVPLHSCMSNKDCPATAPCDPTTHRCTPIGPHCKSNADCPAGEICDETNGTCHLVPPCTAAHPILCCDPAKSPTPCPRKSCASDSDCPAGWVCERPDPSDPRMFCVPK